MKRKCTTVYFQTLYFHVKLTYYKFFYTLLFPSQHISQESYEDKNVLWVVLIESMWSEMKATILIRSTFSEKDREKKLWIPHRSLKKNIASNYTYFFIIWCHPSYEMHVYHGTRRFFVTKIVIDVIWFRSVNVQHDMSVIDISHNFTRT